MDRRHLVYRWDLDKTYLRTEFDTFRDLLRTFFEPFSRKQTFPGAAPLLREIQATEPASISILSGSPEQMRRVLEAKLRLDGIYWDEFLLKPSLKHLLLGRWWWILTPVILSLFMFIALYWLSVSISEYIDPRTRIQRVGA